MAAVNQRRERNKRNRTANKKSASSEIKTVVYVGPTLQQTGLRQFETFKDGIPKHAKLAGQDVPALLKLFVPLADFAKKRKQVMKRDTPEAALIDSVRKSLN